MKSLKALFCLALAIISLANPAKAQKSLDPSYGYNPSSRLLLASDGNYYGENGAGGLGNGTIYQLSSGGALKVVYSFGKNANDGSQPEGGLRQGSDGFLYGTTLVGGANGRGTVFKLSLSGSLTTLHSFAADGDGYYPDSGVVEGPDTNLYGFTEDGGAVGNGTVFKVTPTGVETIVHSFTGGAESTSPGGAIALSSDGSTLYGFTTGGGGIVFSVTTGGTLTPIKSFPIDGGSNPAPNLILNGSGIYGAVSNGLFQLTTAGAVTSFTSIAGISKSDVILATNGNFYVATYTPTNLNAGSIIYQVSPGGVVSALASLSQALYPSVIRLTQGSDSNLYGTASGFGNTVPGGVFQLSTSGVATPLYAFSSTYPNDTPTMPVWGLMLLAVLILVAVVRHESRVLTNV